MASNNTPRYQPIAPLPDWKELLQSLAAYIEAYEADHKKPPVPWIDAGSRAGRIGNYVADLEWCLERANETIRYYEILTLNQDRLIAVMEESRNQAYDVIGRLKNEIGAAKKHPPFADGGRGEPRTEKGGSHE